MAALWKCVSQIDRLAVGGKSSMTICIADVSQEMAQLPFADDLPEVHKQISLALTWYA